jgi:release factor glutamine methyltransferase
MATYREIHHEAKKMARKKGKEVSGVDLLLLHFSGLNATELYLRYEDDFEINALTDFYSGLEQYLNHNKPIQQIIGYVYFYGYQFLVKNTALIPRFETEELVANLLSLYDEYFNGKDVEVLDIGTGSGCLAIALAKEESKMILTATDISYEALTLAKENASNLNAKVNFYQGDLFEPVQGKRYDILVSNPPYIPNNEEVDPLIYDNEPHLALFGGEDGLDFYRRILKESKHYLKDQAIIAFEHGFDKKIEIHQIAKLYFPDAYVFTLQDMQKKDRMTFIIIGF